MERGEDKPTDRAIFSTYPTIMNAINDETTEDGQKLFTPGHFDIIIIDEAHRSIFKKYRAIFEYFDAVLIGLTATPKNDVGHNTYDFFDLPMNTIRLWKKVTSQTITALNDSSKFPRREYIMMNLALTSNKRLKMLSRKMMKCRILSAVPLLTQFISTRILPAESLQNLWKRA